MGWAAALFLAYLRAHVRRILEYRANFFIGVVAIMSRHVIQLLALWVVFSRAGSLGGWQPFQVVYLYGYTSLVLAIWHLLFANTLRVEYLVRDGGFDRYMVRPPPVLFQLLFHYFDDDALGDFIPAVACLVVASARLGIDYTAETALVFVLGVAGGVLVHVGVHLTLSAWSFWYVKSRALLQLFSDVRHFGEYPIRIFPPFVQLALTLLVPVAFAGYYQSEEILGFATLSRVAWLSLPVGIGTVAVGLVVWHAGLARYQGTGS